MEVAEHDLVTLSRQKWEWMSQRQTDQLAGLLHEEAVFVHMGATMTKAQELEVIDTGRIHYKNIDIHPTCVATCRRGWRSRWMPSAPVSPEPGQVGLRATSRPMVNPSTVR